MRRAISGLDEVIAIAQTSATQMPAFAPTGQVFDQKLVVFADKSRDLFALLSSSIHRLWATQWGSTRTGDPVYTPSDVFDTFPRPASTNRMAEMGNVLNVERQQIMLRRDLGLTKLYNLVNSPALPDADDPDVARLRQIHVELDEAVRAAYGWSDVPLGHGFHAYRQMVRWTVSPVARVEILDRLLAENLRRSATQEPKAARSVAPRKAVPRRKLSEQHQGQGAFFHD